MTINRFAKRRDQNEPEIIEHFEDKHGCSVDRLDTPCDLTVHKKGFTGLFEVKMPGKKPNAKQQVWWDQFQGYGCIVSSIEEVDDYMNSIRNEINE